MNAKDSEHLHCISTSSDSTHERERFRTPYNAYKHLQTAHTNMKDSEHNGSKQSTNVICFKISCESIFNLLFPFQSSVDLRTSLKNDFLLRSTWYASCRIKPFTIIYRQRCGQWLGKKIIKQHPLTHLSHVKTTKLFVHSVFKMLWKTI